MTADVPAPPVVVDLGHGGQSSDGCKITQVIDGVERVTSEDDYVLHLGAVLDQRCKTTVELYRTRTRDVFLSLEDRAEIVRQVRAGLYLSLHVDARPRGSEPKPGWARCRFYVRAGDTLALRVAQRIDARMPDRLRRDGRPVVVVQRDDRLWPRAYNTLKRAPCAAVLLECGYSTDPDDVRALFDPVVQAELIDAICAGIGEYAVAWRGSERAGAGNGRASER